MTVPRWRVYRDPKGELWLDPGDGDGALMALDVRALGTMRGEWGALDRATAEEKFGPLTELVDPRSLLPAAERWPLLRLVDGKTAGECAEVAVRVAGRARDAEDAILLLEACGLRSYAKGGPS